MRYDKEQERAIDEAVNAIVKDEELKDEVTRRVRLIKEIGEDTFDQFDVLRFKKHFRDGSGNVTTFTYAAIKVNDTWYTTGGHKYSWGALLKWLVSGPTPTTFVEKALTWVGDSAYPTTTELIDGKKPNYPEKPSEDYIGDPPF